MASSFDVEKDNGYSREKFYTHSTDKHGHRGAVRVGLPPELVSQLSQLVASQVIPDYRTVGDFCRDAIFHRAHEIAEQVKNGELKRVVTNQARLDTEVAYEIAEETEMALARSFEKRLGESRNAHTQEYVWSALQDAQTHRGRDELRRVFTRYFA